MEEERTPAEQEEMALAAKAPEDETPAAKAEATTQPEGNKEEVPGKESVADSVAGEVDKNFFSKTWEFIVDKAEFTVPLFFVLSLVTGLIVGYSVMGDGPVKDIFNPDTWTHIVKLIFG